MKRLLVSLLFLVAISFTVFASDAVYERNRPDEIVGWSVSGADDDIDTTAELITELNTTYAQLAAEGKIEVLSGDAGDTTQTVTVTGIDDSGNKISETFTLAGATVQTSTATFRYIDQASVDIECAGVISIRAVDDTLVTSIPIGVLDATQVQHFNGEKISYITGWRASCTSTTGSLIFDLRFYPDDADCLDAGDGYRILDQIVFTNVLGTQNRPFPQPIRVEKGGWIAVYCKGGANNADGSVTIQGIDITQ